MEISYNLQQVKIPCGSWEATKGPPDEIEGQQDRVQREMEGMKDYSKGTKSAAAELKSAMETAKEAKVGRGSECCHGEEVHMDLPEPSWEVRIKMG